MITQRFRDQVAVITGGADGLGKAIASRIASEGGIIVLLDINEALLQATVTDFVSRGFTAAGFAVDVSSEDEVMGALDEVERLYGRIDMMVNSAGIVGPTSMPITAYSAEAFDQLYKVNLRGAFLTTKYAVQKMEKRGYGRILLIASIAGKEGNPFMVGYSSTKAGVIGLVKAVGKEYAEKGITINGLAPAVIKTAMNEDTAPEQLEYMLSKIPMKRLGTVEEVAAIAGWILSQEASFTTGFTFDISGGRATY